MSLLALSSVGVSRGSHRLLDKVTFTIESPGFTAVVGPNGAGKSTLLRAITGEWACTGGVALFGLPLAKWDRTQLARRLAVMTQHPSLAFDFTVREVATMGRLPHRGEGLAREQTAIGHILSHLALEAFADRSYLSLSGGERQRVQFARVVAQLWGSTTHSLLLLDEPTSALDLAQQRSVLGYARALSRDGVGVIAVLHDLNLASRYADRVLMMHGGRLAFDGTPEQVLDARRIETVFGVAVDTPSSELDGRPLIVLRP